MTHYDLLGVTRDASADQVAKAYRRAARATHPDVGGDADQFAAVAAAYETLSDATAREAYDRCLAEPSALVDDMDLSWGTEETVEDVTSADQTITLRPSPAPALERYGAPGGLGRGGRVRALAGAALLSLLASVLGTVAAGSSGSTPYAGVLVTALWAVIVARAWRWWAFVLALAAAAACVGQTGALAVAVCAVTLAIAAGEVFALTRRSVTRDVGHRRLVREWNLLLAHAERVGADVLFAVDALYPIRPGIFSRLTCQPLGSNDHVSRTVADVPRLGVWLVVRGEHALGWAHPDAKAAWDSAWERHMKARNV